MDPNDRIQRTLLITSAYTMLSWQVDIPDKAMQSGVLMVSWSALTLLLLVIVRVNDELTFNSSILDASPLEKHSSSNTF